MDEQIKKIHQTYIQQKKEKYSKALVEFEELSFSSSKRRLYWIERYGSLTISDKMYLEKVGKFLYFLRVNEDKEFESNDNPYAEVIKVSSEEKGVCRFNLSSQKFEVLCQDKKIKTLLKWKHMRDENEFFKYINIDKIVPLSDTHLLKTLQDLKKGLGQVRNIGRICEDFQLAQNLETFYLQGIEVLPKYRKSDSWYYTPAKPQFLPKKSFSDYSKLIQNFLKKKKEYHKKFERIYEEVTYTKDKNGKEVEYNLIDQVLEYIDRADIRETFEENLTSLTVLIGDSEYYSSERYENLVRLLSEYNCNFDSLMGYLEYCFTFEGIPLDESITFLEDYYRMARLIGRKVDKYPKYLKSIHDIITVNYNTFKKEYNEQAFKRMIREELEHDGQTFSIVVPKESKDVVKEGTSLGHCVGSYVDDIISGRTYIMFLRLKKSKDDSLVTVEIKGKKIIQALGARNRQIEEKEKKFLESYAKNKNLVLGV